MSKGFSLFWKGSTNFRLTKFIDFQKEVRIFFMHKERVNIDGVDYAPVPIFYSLKIIKERANNFYIKLK
jgi:hypothetical protein